MYEINGFTFDGGPTVITAPFMFDNLWAAAGRRREDYFDIVPLDPYYRIFDHEGRCFDYNGDERFILSEIEKRSPQDKEGYLRFMATTTVGLMVMHIIGYQDADAIPYAIKLDVALQLTNILRDIGEDWRQGRLYLPQEEQDAFGVSEEVVAHGRVTSSFRAKSV